MDQMAQALQAMGLGRVEKSILKTLLIGQLRQISASEQGVVARSPSVDEEERSGGAPAGAPPPPSPPKREPAGRFSGSGLHMPCKVSPICSTRELLRRDARRDRDRLRCHDADGKQAACGGSRRCLAAPASPAAALRS